MLFEKVSASETKAGRVIHYASSQEIDDNTLKRMQKDKIIANVITRMVRTTGQLIDVTVASNRVGDILDDLRTVDPTQFDKWLAMELQAALHPRKPLQVSTKHLPQGGPFGRLTLNLL